MTESATQKRNRLAAQALREVKDRNRCSHDPESAGTDQRTGRPFCIDCGDFTDGGPQNV
jgi:hypothetical protein